MAVSGSTREYSNLVAVFAFALGALMYYSIFYRARLVPRWLAGWGLLGALLMLVACLLALFSDAAVTGHTVLILPIAVQEMLLAGRLLVKGFSPPRTFSTSSEPQQLSAGTPQPS